MATTVKVFWVLFISDTIDAHLTRMSYNLHELPKHDSRECGWIHEDTLDFSLYSSGPASPNACLLVGASASNTGFSARLVTRVP
jgi:hypothetical protein